MVYFFQLYFGLKSVSDQADLFSHICIVLHPLFFLRSVHSQEGRIFDYEVPLAAKNENMATGSEPAVEREWM